jgi:hypothetical protein
LLPVCTPTSLATRPKCFKLKEENPSLWMTPFTSGLFSHSSQPPTVWLSLSLCASNTYKKTHVAYYKTSQPTSSYFF